jgi:hypothetical protein
MSRLLYLTQNRPAKKYASAFPDTRDSFPVGDGRPLLAAAALAGELFRELPSSWERGRLWFCTAAHGFEAEPKFAYKRCNRLLPLLGTGRHA